MLFNHSLKKLALVAALTVSAHSVEVDTHVDALVNFYGDFSNDASDDNRVYNTQHDIHIESDFIYNEGVSFTVGLDAVSRIAGDSIDPAKRSSYPRGARPVENIAEPTQNQIALANAHINWQFIENATFMMGRFQYDAGSISTYRPYQYQTSYSSIFKERSVHGFGLKAADFVGYIGFNGQTNDALSFFLSYDATLLDSRDMKLNVQPIVDWRLNDGDGRKWHLALDNDFSSHLGELDYSIHNTIAWMPHLTQGETWNILLEPNFQYQGFGLGLGYYYSSPATGHVEGGLDDIELQTDMPVQEFWYMEPFIPVSDKWAIGFPVSHHDVSRYISDDHFWEYGIAGYAYPSSGIEFGAQVGLKNVPAAKDFFYTEVYGEVSF